MASFPRIRRALPRLLLAAIASGIGVEIGARLLDRLRGRPWDGEERRAAVEAACRVISWRTFIPGGHQDRAAAESDSSMSILSLFSGWENYRSHARVVAELAHYKSPEGKAAYDICVLGGSVAQSFAQVGDRRLIERLREDPRFRDRDLRVHDDACAGYEQPQPLMVLAYLRARGHEPDAVIEIDGFNEAALGWNNASLGAIPADDEWTAQALVRGWEESSISMLGLCAARGILYLHVLQPALPDPGTKPLTATEIERGVADPTWIEGVRRLYPRMREAGDRPGKRGIAFFDATGVLRDHPEDVYTDACHFGEHGNEISADAIAQALLRAAAR